MSHARYHTVLSLRQRLRAWCRASPGKPLWEAERAELDTLLPDLFGYHVLQVGCLGVEDLLTTSRVLHRMVLDQEAVPVPDGISLVRGRADALPIANDSLDVLVLPHTLEFEDDPHQVLREMERTLIPEGHIVIVGFNPRSLWGLWRLLFARFGGVPWRGRFFSPARVKDWLALLGFDTVVTRLFFYRPPLRHEGVMHRLHFMEALGARWWPILGGAYVLVAKKRVVTLTPIKPRWRPRRGVVTTGLAEPTRRCYGG